MAKTTSADIRRRVATAAEAVLEQQGHVSAIDVLLTMRWLTPTALKRWEQGRADDLESVMEVRPEKLFRAMVDFHGWAEDRGLEATEGEYVARTRTGQRLAFTTERSEALERTFRIHWVSPDVTPRKKQSIEAKTKKAPDLVVISPLKDFTCEECGGGGDLLIMEGDGPLCMSCADMDHLVFLPSGNAALTRRAKKESRLSAVVLRWSRSRKRYERQGLLVEEEALERAEEQCLADEDLRAARRQREALRRTEEDEQYTTALTAEIRRLFPGCPEERATSIARHTAARGSGRVGRSAAAREFDPGAIELAVVASVRHRDTDYDDLLMSGLDRPSARREVRPEVARILDEWRNAGP